MADDMEFADKQTICVVGEGSSVFYFDVPESKPNPNGIEANYAREIFNAKFKSGALRLADADEEAALREREGLPKKATSKARTEAAPAAADTVQK